MLDGRLNDRLDLSRLVFTDPVREIDIPTLHISDLDRIALEQIGDDAKVAIVGELVSEELAVVKDAEDIA